MRAALRNQISAVHRCSHCTSLRIDCDDSCAVPDVCVDFTLDVFQLVELANRLAIFCYSNRTYNSETVRVEKSKTIRAIAQNQRLAVGSKSPTFRVIRT